MRNDRMLDEAQRQIEEDDRRSVPALRACMLALANGYPAPVDALKVLTECERSRVHMTNKQASAVGARPTETDPKWLEPAATASAAGSPKL